MLFVILSHVSLTRGFPSHGLKPVIDRLGTAGVDVFFVLSGFLITTLLRREVDRSKRVSLRSFYLRRVLRIVPAYAAFLLFVVALSLAGRAQIARGDWLAALTYTMNFRAHPAWELGHIWSLSIEEHFYLVWPPLFAFLPRRAAVYGLCAVLVFEPLVRIAMMASSEALIEAAELWTFTRLDGIAAGCLVALVSSTPAGARSLDWLTERWPLALVAIVASIGGGMWSGKFEIAVAPSLQTLGIVGVIWAAVRKEPRWLENRVVVMIGVGSYSLYLWQEVFMNPHRFEWENRFPQNVVLVTALAAISYHAIERPFLRIKDRGPSR